MRVNTGRQITGMARGSWVKEKAEQITSQDAKMQSLKLQGRNIY